MNQLPERHHLLCRLSRPEFQSMQRWQRRRQRVTLLLPLTLHLQFLLEIQQALLLFLAVEERLPLCHPNLGLLLPHLPPMRSLSPKDPSRAMSSLVAVIATETAL